MRALRALAVLTLGIAAALPTFATGTQQQAPGVPVVVVSILPQAYFVERIAGSRVKAMVLVGPGQSPHSYEPTPRQMAELSQATMWLTIGVEFEAALKPKVAALNPRLAIIDTTAGVTYRTLEAHQHAGEASSAQSDESGIDPHVWLGRQAVKAMAASIRDALSSGDPAGASTYRANHDAFVRDIDATYARIAAEVAPLAGKTVFVYHPSFGYFLDEFDITQEAVETGGKEPTQKELTALIRNARADGARVIFVQPQFPASAARAVAGAIGGVVVEIDALAPDWMDNIGRIGAALARAAK